jgi:HEAT repeat protein
MTSLPQAEKRGREARVLSELQSCVDDQRRRHLLLELYPVASDLSLPAVEPLLHVGRRQVRTAAIHVLAKIGTNAAIRTLASALQEQDDLGVIFTANALRGESAWEAAPALVRCLDERRATLDAGAKLAIIRAMARMPHRSQVSALTATLADGNRHVRRASLAALSSFDSRFIVDGVRCAASQLSWVRGRRVRKALADIERDLAR